MPDAARPASQTDQAPRRLILLGGPSGSGKTFLAARHGDPHLRLDDFYREIAEDAVTPLPRTPYGQIDWDHPGTWNDGAAVAAVCELLETGRTHTPDYRISDSSVHGSTEVRCGSGPIVAEGIFAAVALRRLRSAGVEVRAYYVEQPRWLTALLRFVRDVREHRKPLPFLLRRGWALYRAEPGVRRLHLEAGFVPVPKRRLARLLGNS